MTALLILGIITVMGSTVTAVSVAVLSRRSVSDAFRALERHDQRAEKSLQSVLDRLMTIRWEDFAAVQAIQDEDEEGAFIVPESEGETEVEEPGPWGHLSTLGERLRHLEEEDAIIDEDFDERGEPRRSTP